MPGHETLHTKKLRINALSMLCTTLKCANKCHNNGHHKMLAILILIVNKYVNMEVEQVTTCETSFTTVYFTNAVGIIIIIYDCK